MVQEATDRVIYLLTRHTLSGHTLKHLSAAMVPVFTILMLAKRRPLHVCDTQMLQMILFYEFELCASLWLEILVIIV